MAALANSSSYNSFVPRIGERMEVMISHAEYEKEQQHFILWGQFHLVQVEKIEDALADLQDLAQQKDHPRGQLQPGDLCLGKSIQDNQWHRASIQTATGNDVLAFYIDYGSTEFVPQSRIRMLDPDLTLNFEAQATKLLLRGIQPIFVRGGIKTGTLDYLDRYVVNKVFLCEPMEHHGDATSVKLYALNGKRDVAAQFIADGFAEPATHQPSSSPVPAEKVVEFSELPVMGLDVGQRARVYVSYHTSPTRFWLQQEVVAIDLDDMMSDIQAFFQNQRGAQPVSHVVPNLPCVTKLEDDKLFYRCQVVRSTGLQTCEVILLDYGNMSEVAVSELYHLPDQFAKLPGAAIEAGLSGIDPKSCSTEAAANRFNELTEDRILCVKADSFDGPKVMVSMVDPRSDLNLSIGEILIKEKLASRTAARRPHGPPTDGLAPSTRSSSRSTTAPQASRREQVAAFRYPILREGSRYPVIATDIASSHDFACQLLSDSGKFEEMIEILQRDYASKGARDEKLTGIRVGSVCCAQFSDDHLWYRAEVTRVMDGSAEVYFVDYGNSEVVPFGKLKQLTQAYTAMEVQSFRCTLEGLEEVQRFSDQMKSKFEELVGEDELEARICRCEDRAYTIELSNKVSRLNVNEEMKRFCSSLRPQKTSAPRRSVPEEFRKIEPGRRDKMKVYVSNIESPNLFHCQPVSSAEELQRLMDALNDPGSHSPSTSPPQPTLQAPCMAQYSVDEVWYRAVITGVKRSGGVEVRFVDFGNHETVSPSAIRPLQDTFMSFPMQGIPCSLEGLSFKSWTDEEINQFSAICGGDEHEVEFGNRVGENYEVRLKTETGLCVNDVLQAPAHVPSAPSPGRGSSKPQQSQSRGEDIHQFIERDLEVGRNIPVYISHVENLSEIWCQPAASTEDLESLMVKLDQTYGKLKAGERTIKNPRLGMACVAQFQEDRNWYRAIVINKQLKRAYVCFVDYGNFEYVPTSCIKAIDQAIMKIPTVAVKCSLRGSKDLDGPLRIKKLRGLVDEVESFNCKVITSENGVFEVDITYRGGKSVVEVLKKLPKDEPTTQAKQQTPPRAQKSSPPMKPAQPTSTKSPPQVQRSFESRPQRHEKPPPAVTSKKEDWGNVSSEPTATRAPPVPEKPAPPVILKNIKQQEESLVIGEFVDVFVSFLESPAKFWLQQASRSSEIDSLMETLTDNVTNSKLQPLKEAVNGQLCVAKSVTDEAYYRARILKRVSDNQIEVYYLDYGNKEVVPTSSVFAITPDLLTLPAQAVQCSLKVSKGSVFAGAAIDRFTELTIDKQLVAKPTKKSVNSLQVELVDTNSDEDVDILAEMKKAMDQLAVTSLPAPEIPESGTVYVTQVAEDGSFFIQLASSTAALEEIHAELQKAYAEETTALGEATPGQLCCSLYGEEGEDREWYRGVVESVQDSGDACVRFLDYGNTSTCKVSELKLLLPQFMDKPAVAIKCELHDLHLTGVLEIGITLEELTLDKELTCAFHDKEIPCQVSLSENDVNLNEILKDKFDNQLTAPPKVDSEPGTTWVSQALETGKKFEAYVSSVVSPGYFFVQPSSVTKELEDLMVEMQSAYSQPSAELLLCAGDIPPGTLCASLYAEDNLWYRAEVVQQDGDQVTVHFPDYGNSDVVSKGNLKVLMKKHSDFSLKAIGCSLSDVSPASGTWSSQSGEFFEAETMDKPLLVEITTMSDASPQAAKVIHSVRLLDMGMNVADKLVKAGHASDGSTTIQGEAAETPTLTELVMSDTQVFSGYPSYRIDPGATEGMFLTAVTSLSDFCIQLSRHANEVEEFGGRVDKFYKANEVPAISDAKVGSPCVVQYSEDEVWYRAVITDITDDNAYVTFVDYGNGDSTSVSSVRELKEEFLGQPAYAFRCSLAGIDSEQSTNEEKVAKFEELMDKETLTAKVMEAKDGVLKVQLLDGGSSVAGSLGLEEDLTAFDLKTQEAMTVEAPETARALSTTMYPGYNSRTLPAGSVKPVFLTSVAAFSEFCIQLGSDADAVANFTAEVDEFYKGNEVPPLESVDVGAACAAQFTDDEVWYRALVITLEDDNADVLFVDYGNSDTLPKASLRVLKEQFLEAPTFALKCRLAGVDETADENEAALDKFQEFLECENLQARVVDCDDEILSVQLLNNGKSIAADLGITETPEVPVKTYKPYEISPGAAEDVYLTSVSSLSDFAIQLKKFEDAVAEFNARLDEFYKTNTVASLDPVVPGMQCVGRFSDDGVWYRGKVESLEGTAAEVTFVDYGNNDLIEGSELKELHTGFAEQHTFAFQCRLAGVKKGGHSEDTVTKFEGFMESEGLVASVVGLDEDGRLSVQLLEGEESVAVKLGLEEDLASEKDSGLNTTAHSLVEDALSSALEDIKLEESAEAEKVQTEQEGETLSTEGNEELPGEPTEAAPGTLTEDPGKLEDPGTLTEVDPGSIADALVKEVVESACRELTQLSLGEEEETAPSVGGPEASTPRISVSPPGEEDEFEDAATSPEREGTHGDDVEGALNVEGTREDSPSGEEDDSFEDALDQSQTVEKMGDNHHGTTEGEKSRELNPENEDGQIGEVGSGTEEIGNGEHKPMASAPDLSTVGEAGEGDTVSEPGKVISGETTKDTVARDGQDVPSGGELNGHDEGRVSEVGCTSEGCVENGVPSGEEDAGQDGTDSKKGEACDGGDVGQKTGSEDDSTETQDKEATPGGDADMSLKVKSVMASEGDVPEVEGKESTQVDDRPIEGSSEEQTEG